ncbi:MAG: YceI family protein [Fulvivirga sp.]
MVNRKLVLLMLVVAFSTTATFAQKYKSKSSEITFFSEAPVENIDATNKDASSVFDEGKNEIVFSVPIRSFEFDKSLMQEHFNEKYMESEEYPNALFTGTVQGYDKSKSGQQQATAKGKMTIHGVTQPVEITGSISKTADEIEIQSTFIIRLEDYKIKIPKVLWQNIAEEVEVKIKFVYQPL